MNKYIFLVGSMIFLTLTQIFGQSEIESIKALVTQDKAAAHIRFLASDELKGRDTGSEGIDIAAEYIKSNFLSHGIISPDGINDYEQEILFEEFIPSQVGSISIGNSVLNIPNDFIVMNGQEFKKNGETVFVSFGRPSDFEGKNVEGKFIVSLAGDGESTDVGTWVRFSRDKRKRAMEAGALGLIEVYRNTQTPWSLIQGFGNRPKFNMKSDQDDHEMANFFHVWAQGADTDAVKQLLEEDTEIDVHLAPATVNQLYSSNVIGLVPGMDAELKDEYIVFGAHYDHVGIGRPDAQGDSIYNGTRDNAIGTAAILLLAEKISKTPLKRSALFVLFTAEEKGLLGSQYFVDHSPVPLDNIKYCFNIDNGGYNDTSIVTIIGLTRTEAEQDIVQSSEAFGLGAIEDPTGVEQGLFDRSDNVSFAKKGIPAPTFSLGFRAFDKDIYQYYHQPGDEFESINLPYVTQYIRAFILSAQKIGNAENVPFWNEGDKYYEVGKSLYAK